MAISKENQYFDLGTERVERAETALETSASRYDLIALPYTLDVLSIGKLRNPMK